ncbi:uracil-DNA glycosylase family protein [Pseudopontixanthobacter vadosimaris]|uniref:uracil-DNA glycosylase family protein n=1 Tax=Pseudopontixanthobacter vadosimaris TaxID=2726450 RepID=UPI001473E7A6|nr:uracil-DNA glycosylase family protein [Pseudopontixanthobacter vadosimaris]
MNNQQTSDRPHGHGLDLAAQFSAVLDWWREAGVDCDFSDDATGWLAQAEADSAAKPPAAAKARRKPAAEAKPLAMLGGEKSGWPVSLDDFAPWWLNESTLDDGGTYPRIAPRGPAAAELMVLVAEPEASDTERLLSGEQGRLLDNMLAAMNMAEDAVYFASVLPRNTPMPDWDDLAARGLSETLVHHIGLVAPRRLVLFGRTIPPLVWHDAPQDPAVPREFTQNGRSIPALAVPGLDRLLRRGSERARFWRRYLDWTGPVHIRQGKA